MIKPQSKYKGIQSRVLDFLEHHLFQSVAALLVIFSFFISSDRTLVQPVPNQVQALQYAARAYKQEVDYGAAESSRAMQFAAQVSKNNAEILEAVMEIKLVLAVVEDLNITLLSGPAGEFMTMLGRIENLLILSSTASLVEVLMLQLSKSHVFFGLAVFLLLGSFSKQYGPNCKHWLLIILAISPGLTIYSVASHRISEKLRPDFSTSLHLQLTQIASEMKLEKKKLYQLHQQKLHKIAKTNKFIGFFEKVKEDVSYTVSKDFDSLDGDYKTIKEVLKSGPALIKETISFCAHLFLFNIIMPLGYLGVLYLMIKHILAPRPT